MARLPLLPTLLVCLIGAADASAQSNRPQLAPATSPVTITMPDGTQVTGASQIMLFFTGDSTTAQQQAAVSAAMSRGAQVLGQVPNFRVVQLGVPDTNSIARILVELQVLPGVRYAGPVLFLGRRQGRSACDAGAVGPDPSNGATGWFQAGNFADSGAASANDVAMVVIDEFHRAGERPNPPGLARHGDVVAAYAMDAAGRSSTGQPLFQLGQNVFEVEDTADASSVPRLIDDLSLTLDQILAGNPRKKVVINYSAGPRDCSDKSNPNLLSADPALKDAALARCAAADALFYAGMNAAVKAANERHGNRVVWVNAAANFEAALPPQQAQASSTYIPVAGLDQTSPRVTRTSWSETGAAIPIVAPACNISPISLTVPPNTPLLSSGNSFAAPQVAGQIAALWAAHPDLTASQIGSQIFAMPKVGPNQTAAQLNGRTLAALVDAHAPVNEPAPSPVATLPCPSISVTPPFSTLAVNGTVRLAATAEGGGSTDFRYQSSNPRIATVDRNGQVRVLATGVALISVTSPDSFCAAQASVVVPSETYTGTMSINATVSVPNDGWAPNPMIVTSVTSGAPIRLLLAGSLLTAGPFAGAMVQGPGSITVTVPSATCTACDPPITVPGSTTTSSMPVSSGPVTGISDGRIINIPVPGFPAITGTVAVLASNVQITLNWSFQMPAGGGTTSMQMSATLTKQ
jgi:hypothetical protein